MSVSRRIVRVLLACALCAACALAGPALVAGAASGRGHARRTAARRSSACRRHHHAPRRCRIASKRARLHAGHRRRAARDPASGFRAAGEAGAPTSSGGGAGASPTGATTAPGGAGGSPAGGPGGQTTGATAVPPVEPPAEGPVHVQVIAKEYSFTLSRAEVPAGKVIVEFVNDGEDSHNLHFQEPAEASEAGAFPTSSPGFHGDLTLNLHPGSYTLFCSLPGHEAKGMKATLIVR
jgi:plastocyanin